MYFNDDLPCNISFIDSQMTPEEFEKTICEALDEAISIHKFTIIHDYWGDLNKKICDPFGAYVLKHKPEINQQEFGLTAGSQAALCNKDNEVGTTNFWSFIYGFGNYNIDDPGGKPHAGPWYELGLKLYQKYKPISKFPKDLNEQEVQVEKKEDQTTETLLT